MIDIILVKRLAIVSALFLTDISLTYACMFYLRKFFPKSDWSKNELNFITRLFWKTWGLEKGTFFFALVIYPVIFLLSLFLIKEDFVFGSLIGMYIIVLINNFKQLQWVAEYGKEKNKK